MKKLVNKVAEAMSIKSIELLKVEFADGKILVNPIEVKDNNITAYIVECDKDLLVYDGNGECLYMVSESYKTQIEKAVVLTRALTLMGF